MLLQKSAYLILKNTKPLYRLALRVVAYKTFLSQPSKLQMVASCRFLYARYMTDCVPLSTFIKPLTLISACVIS